MDSPRSSVCVDKSPFSAFGSRVVLHQVLENACLWAELEIVDVDEATAFLLDVADPRSCRDRRDNAGGRLATKVLAFIICPIRIGNWP